MLMLVYQERSVWILILACLAAVILTCGLKNYLIVMVSGTVLCPYLCSSVFHSDPLFSFPLLEPVFNMQTWIQGKFQGIVDQALVDKWKLATALLFAPAFEELVYRGPLYLTRALMHNPLWWLSGTVLAVVFALSHNRSGLALLPLIVLGICSLWLISTTQRLWPSVALHFLHNFFFSSVLVYQSLWIND